MGGPFDCASSVLILKMAIDDPFPQVEALIKSDERQSLPELPDAVLKALEKVPLPGIGPW